MTKLKDKPFALIGVNCWNDDPAKLKAAILANNITWRTFEAQGPIANKWNTPATPTMCVIDHTGLIRDKWVGKISGQVVGETIEELIRNPEDELPTN